VRHSCSGKSGGYREDHGASAKKIKKRPHGIVRLFYR